MIVELSRKLLREALASRETADGRLKRLQFVRSSTAILDLTDDIATVAGEIDIKRKETVRDWGLADSIVLATAQESGAKVVTGDRHFQDLGDEIVFLN